MKSQTSLVSRLLSAIFLMLLIWTNSAAAATEKVLYNFSTYARGASPMANLIADASGNLYGTTGLGGAYGLGVVYKLTPSTHGQWTETVLYSFKGGTDGEYPKSRLIFDAAGNLYGTTSVGGTGCTGGCGTVFKLAPSARFGWRESVIYNFQGGSDGQYPNAGLIWDSAGNLYGTTVLGGTQSVNCPGGSCGTVFKLAPGSFGRWTESVLYSFTGSSDGGQPEGELIFDSAGSLYGTASLAGASGAGTVFKLTPSSNSWTLSVLHSFAGSHGNDGSEPISALIFDKAGNLYGTTLFGGAKSCAGGCGTVFELISNGNGSFTESVLHYFVGGASDGGYPAAGLIFDQAGNLYGATGGPGKPNGPDGVVFQLAPASGGQWTETILHAFTGSFDGMTPAYGGTLVFDPAGNLYGATYRGGPANVGTAFELTPSTGGQWTKSTIYSFPASDGLQPNSKLVEDSSGNFYGSTFYGGTSGKGVVFKIAPNSSSGWTESTLYSFKGTTDGSAPSNLAIDKSGNLYGSAVSSQGLDLIFELKRNGSGAWTESTLYTFSSNTTDGKGLDGLMVAPNGSLFGETVNGGTYLLGGTVFELTNNGTGAWTKTILFNFLNDATGTEPGGGVVMDAAGNLYGTAFTGGTSRRGIVFELSPSSSGQWTETVLYSFAGGSDGDSPVAGLTFDPAGNLYGTTYLGGTANLGTAFMLKHSSTGWTESVLHSFTGGSDGASTLDVMPELEIDAAGNLYGNTPQGGGTCNCGVLFELSPGSGGQWTETILHAFTGSPTDGAGGNPLTLDPAGILYGTSASGGTAGDGTFFKVTP